QLIAHTAEQELSHDTASTPAHHDDVGAVAIGDRGYRRRGTAVLHHRTVADARSSQWLAPDIFELFPDGLAPSVVELHGDSGSVCLDGRQIGRVDRDYHGCRGCRQVDRPLEGGFRMLRTVYAYSDSFDPLGVSHLTSPETIGCVPTDRPPSS